MKPARALCCISLSLALASSAAHSASPSLKVEADFSRGPTGNVPVAGISSFALAINLDTPFVASLLVPPSSAHTPAFVHSEAAVPELVPFRRSGLFGQLYHGTTWPSVIAAALSGEGLRVGTYVTGSARVAKCYARIRARERGEKGVVLELPASILKDHLNDTYGWEDHPKTTIPVPLSNLTPMSKMLLNKEVEHLASGMDAASAQDLRDLVRLALYPDTTP